MSNIKADLEGWPDGLVDGPFCYNCYHQCPNPRCVMNWWARHYEGKPTGEIDCNHIMCEDVS